jgi:hypothetical protein
MQSVNNFYLLHYLFSSDHFMFSSGIHTLNRPQISSDAADARFTGYMCHNISTYHYPAQVYI